MKGTRKLAPPRTDAEIYLERAQKLQLNLESVLFNIEHAQTREDYEKALTAAKMFCGLLKTSLSGTEKSVLALLGKIAPSEGVTDE